MSKQRRKFMNSKAKQRTRKSRKRHKQQQSEKVIVAEVENYIKGAK